MVERVKSKSLSRKIQRVCIKNLADGLKPTRQRKDFLEFEKLSARKSFRTLFNHWKRHEFPDASFDSSSGAQEFLTRAYQYQWFHFMMYRNTVATEVVLKVTYRKTICGNNNYFNS